MAEWGEESVSCKKNQAIIFNQQPLKRSNSEAQAAFPAQDALGEVGQESSP